MAKSAGGDQLLGSFEVRGDDGVLAMARVCRALDGMPLAIELAAASLRTMSVEHLARRLDDRFRLLTSGSRTARPRHKTLRAVVDWSWELLADAERTVLRRPATAAATALLSNWKLVRVTTRKISGIIRLPEETTILRPQKGSGSPV
jgi:predicted ATPase